MNTACVILEVILHMQGKTSQIDLVLSVTTTAKGIPDECSLSLVTYTQK